MGRKIYGSFMFLNRLKSIDAMYLGLLEFILIVVFIMFLGVGETEYVGHYLTCYTSSQ
jgi:drug/metabolite transporter superfamily protein YnfA